MLFPTSCTNIISACVDVCNTKFTAKVKWNRYLQSRLMYRLCVRIYTTNYAVYKNRNRHFIYLPKMNIIYFALFNLMFYTKTSTNWPSIIWIVAKRDFNTPKLSNMLNVHKSSHSIRISVLSLGTIQLVITAYVYLYTRPKWNYILDWFALGCPSKMFVNTKYNMEWKQTPCVKRELKRGDLMHPAGKFTSNTSFILNSVQLFIYWLHESRSTRFCYSQKYVCQQLWTLISFNSCFPYHFLRFLMRLNRTKLESYIFIRLYEVIMIRSYN